jgi:pimeloyl-ACP methyl ester carboxylesterase
VLHDVSPQRPVHVGLSIGGLFAARAILAGAAAEGLVLLNTLRAPGDRLEWIGAATERAFRTGGPALMRDVYAPLRNNRQSALTGDDYTACGNETMAVRLLRDAREADWDIPYEALNLPVLVVTGERDCVFRVPADIERLTARLPDVKQINLTDVGHLIPVEAPQQLASLLIDFATERQNR